MSTMARVAVTVVVSISVYYFVFWVPCALIVPFEHYWIANIISLLAAVAAGRFVWRCTAVMEQGIGACMLRGALIVGGIGFIGGFFGPMIFAPGANQGPLLGLFITGPLGFLLGAIGGLVYGLKQNTRATALQ